jgi:GTP-binding protein Era
MPTPQDKEMTQPTERTVFGFVAIAGRPNVGKSSLLNRYVGRKISITSRRPQTTRNRLLGIKTTDHAQVVFVDTPGIHAAQGRELNRVINRTAVGSLEGVDLILMMITATGWRRDDDLVYAKATAAGVPIILAVNKSDQLDRREKLLPLLEEVSRSREFVEIVPISVKSGYNMDHLMGVILSRLPAGAHGFPADQVTDRGQRFLAGEFVREKLFWHLGQELPYVSAVEVSTFEHDDKGLLRIEATIWVEKPGQKAIVIGQGGAGLKRIGQSAREEMERLFGCRVYLGLWVKVRKGWTDNAALLNSLGYVE